MRAGAATPRPSSTLLPRRERPTQLFGERPEDKTRGIGAGDAARTVRIGRHAGRAVTHGDVAVDHHHRRGVPLGIVVEGGVVTWYLTGVAEPTALVDEADTV